MEKQTASPESSQIGAIGMQRKKHRSINSSLGIQEGSKEGLLKILKGYEDLQESASKVSRDDLNDFESDLELLRDFLESFKGASEGGVESRDSSKDLNRDQFEAE